MNARWRRSAVPLKYFDACKMTSFVQSLDEVNMNNTKLYPYLIACIVALGGFLLGFDGVVNSGAIPFYKTTFGISDQPFLVGLSAGAIILGGIFGNIFAGFVSDLIGRKPSLLITSILFMIGALGTALAPNIIIFIATKFIAGLGVGMAILTAPIYIAEIAPQHLRGKLVTFNQLNIVLGLSVAYFSNYYILQIIENPDLNWRWMLGVGFFPAVLYFVLLFIVPESPRWLLRKGREVIAEKVLVKIGGEEHAAAELQSIKASLASDSIQKKASVGEVFTKKMKFVLFIGFALAFFQQISGINAVLYYAPMIFESAGGTRDAAFLQAIIVGVVFTGMTIVSMALIDRLGRKPLLIIGTGIMAFFLILVAGSFYSANYQLNQQSIEEICESVFQQGVVEEASTINSRAYQKDSINISSSEIQLLKQGEVLATLQMDSEAMQAKKQEIEILKTTLQKIEGKNFENEINFFSTIKDELTQQTMAWMVSQKGQVDLNANNAEGTFNEVVAKETAMTRYSTSYKSLILNHSIQINAILVLIGILGFIAGFSISLGPVMWAMLSEIFPNKLRGLSISIVGALNGLTSFTVATIFPSELEYLGSATTFIIFAAFMVLCLFFVFKYIPETKGKSLEEIERELIKA